MDIFNTEIFLDGFQFTEGLRWHNNNLWFCDLGGNTVYCFSATGQLITKISVASPAGLGWLSDKSLLITALKKRELLQYKDNFLSIFKSLEIATPGYCHDFTVSQNDIIYVSTSGFYPQHKIKPIKSNILMITKERDIKIAASNLGYPNGILITPDGKHLIVAETFSATVSIFDIHTDNTLINQRPWIKFDNLGFAVSFDEHGVPENLNRHYPDGICFDEKLNAVWIASPGKKEVLCIDSHRNCLTVIKTRFHPFDCVLGGQDNQTLFIASSDNSPKNKPAIIEKVTFK
ncbi:MULTISPECIES: SMP-30/gluconolactonase/LRE family protein [unclassified Legionella]|uniref:SMP-30/gluconolactonase/LRE family protein n=1 Tax=unclassified Legionella TaxID=2622702 RepID=UPI001E36960C|nr:SMP-30/gluconolactonase/LRE family protein [Legionella sp. 31fI33]MCC5016017.1 SMP-30/gluconolactonase/LRE family protein [Legionella sp. 31fI33]